MGRRALRWMDAEDIVQQSMLEVCSRSTRPENPSGLLQVLCRTARYRVLDAVRNQRRLVGESGVSPHSFEFVAAGPTDGSVTRADDLRKVIELIHGFPRPYRLVLVCCGLDGLSFADAAARLGIPESTVRKRYQRARMELQRRAGR